MPSQATNPLDAEMRAHLRTWCESGALPTATASSIVFVRMCMWLEAQEHDEQAYWIERGWTRVYDQMIAEDGE